MNADPTDVLNRLLRMLHRSLPMYLAETGACEVWADRSLAMAVTNIAADQRQLSQRLIEAVHHDGGRPTLGSFPMRFTDLHDLSSDFLRQEVLHEQSDEEECLRQCVASLPDETPQRALAEEILGNLQGHRAVLQRPALSVQG